MEVETITLNGKTYYPEQTKQIENGNRGDKAHSFLTVGTIYCFRTVTMIYTGRLLATSEQEFLIEDAAWIAETERWADFLKTGKHKEAEPYCAPVVLNRASMLDVTPFPILIKEQK